MTDNKEAWDQIHTKILEAVSKDYKLMLERIHHLEQRINKASKEANIAYRYMQYIQGEDD